VNTTTTTTTSSNAGDALFDAVDAHPDGAAA
jgi:hypothetical protein